MTHDEPLHGVRGWLLLFCIMLCFLGPITFIDNYGTWLPTVQWRTISNDIYWYIVASFAAELAITLFGAVAGFLLWRKRSFAVTLSKIYLLARPLAALLLWASERYILVPSRPSLHRVFGAILGSIIWFAYLEKSERVRNTYEEDYYQWQVAGSDLHK